MSTNTAGHAMPSNLKLLMERSFVPTVRGEPSLLPSDWTPARLMSHMEARRAPARVLTSCQSRPQARDSECLLLLVTDVAICWAGIEQKEMMAVWGAAGRTARRESGVGRRGPSAFPGPIATKSARLYFLFGESRIKHARLTRRRTRKAAARGSLLGPRAACSDLPLRRRRVTPSVPLVVSVNRGAAKVIVYTNAQPFSFERPVTHR